MKIDIFKKKISKIHNLLIEILERLNLTLNKDPTFQNIAEFLGTRDLISEPYAQKIKILEEKLPSLQEINDIELYLLSRFYHYI